MLNKSIVIIQNTTLAENYGLSTYLRNIILKLAKNHNLNINLICAKGKLNKEVCPKNVQIYEIENNTYSVIGNAIFFINTLKNLLQINKTQRLDTIHCLYPNSSLAAASIMKIFKPKLNIIYDLRSPWIEISVERGSVKKSYSNLFKKLGYISEYLLSYFVNKYIFITHGLYQYYKSKLVINNKSVSIIPSGIDVNFFYKQKKDSFLRKKIGIKEKDLVIGYIGTISDMRSLDVILYALNKIRDKRKDIHIMFVGDGNDKNKLVDLAKKLKLENRVKFTGKVSVNETAKYLSAMDSGICQLPDTFIFRQSFPMKILEYIAGGLSVFASRLQAHDEIKKEFKQINIYNDANDLSNKMLTLKKTKKTLPMQIYEYDWNEITNKIIKNY